MNLFFTSPNLQQCAIDLDDIRLRKMVLETTQILQIAAYLWGCRTTYKPTHKNHPCVVWASEHQYNYIKIAELLTELVSEYNYRFQKTHKCEDLIPEIQEHIRFIGQRRVPRPPPNCTDFKQLPLNAAYKKHLSKKWLMDAKIGRSPTWTKRDVPSWHTVMVG